MSDQPQSLHPDAGIGDYRAQARAMYRVMSAWEKDDDFLTLDASEVAALNDLWLLTQSQTAHLAFCAGAHAAAEAKAEKWERRYWGILMLIGLAAVVVPMVMLLTAPL